MADKGQGHGGKPGEKGGGKSSDYTPNEHRGIVKNPNNPAHEADRVNREKQAKGG
ncbi:MAG TPA: hypothetical protein VF006_33370 [Longimicrobium sp.]